MTGQLSSVQKSVMVPYSMLIWLKKSTAEEGGEKSIFTLNILESEYQEFQLE